MGRASQQQAEQNHQEILRCASRLFRSCGVDRVSVAQVMSAAGLTTGGFYKHFASREILVRETFALAFAQAGALWRKFSTSTPTPPAAEIARRYLRGQSQDQCCPLLAFAAHAAESRDRDAQAAYSAGARQLFAQFREQMKPEADAELLFAAMIGAGFLARACGDAEWIEPLKCAVERAAGAAPLA